MEWKVSFSKEPLPAEENMQRDAEALRSLQPGAAPVLSFHHWNKGSISYGHFVDPADFFDLEAVSRLGLYLVRRPTGGGIVFHEWDLSFSVIIPVDHKNFSQNTLENYAFVNGAVLNAVSEYIGTGSEAILIPRDISVVTSAAERFCMAKPTKYDVMWMGRKIAGAAQRKTKQGFLHQGMISLVPPREEILQEILLPHQRVIDSMRQHAWGLLPPDATTAEIEKTRSELRRMLTEWILRS